MARREVVIITDDLDGSEAAVCAVTFAFEGSDYVLDLSDENHKLLAETLAPFIAAGRRLAGNGTRVMTRTVVKPTGRAYNEAVRAWLKTNGYAEDLNDRGRIAGHLLAAYESRTPKPAAGPAATS